MEMKVVGVYLAAGRSTRMGCDKLSLPLGDAPLGEWGLRSLLRSEVNEVVWVHTQRAPLTLPFSRKPVHVRTMPVGLPLSASVRCGVEVARDLGADALLFALADQPFVTSALLDDLVHTLSRHAEAAYVSFGHGPPMPPLIVRTELVWELRAELAGDRGLGPLLAQSLVSNVRRALSDDYLIFDVDTPADYARATSLWMSLGGDGRDRATGMAADLVRRGVGMQTSIRG
ncbi:MAG: nucleotidyltransferase family protein [Alicyclobacillus mali]|uniref:nucleotidyltransferase family protein n=1 Tax=Alicyclobacillus mali (ex Roth et al. 2021) TaxID=1123961 RepID=UPI001A8E188C|nr:nucleotidyltransferase family protein [Alicyclobacillus mali (ex Roth et al. 2021)]MCL6489985.1 nucleotidyltransferase family protein [Alicyclobacillus mali (ex Roth et al. 2021)]